MMQTTTGPAILLAVVLLTGCCDDTADELDLVAIGEGAHVENGTVTVAVGDSLFVWALASYDGFNFFGPLCRQESSRNTPELFEIWSTSPAVAEVVRKGPRAHVLGDSVLRALSPGHAFLRVRYGPLEREIYVTILSQRAPFAQE